MYEEAVGVMTRLGSTSNQSTYRGLDVGVGVREEGEVWGDVGRTGAL